MLRGKTAGGTPAPRKARRQITSRRDPNLVCICLETSSLGHEKIKRGGNVGFQILAVNHGIEKTVLQQKFRSLKTLGKLLAHGLLDDARPGKSNQRAGLCNIDVS